MLDGRAREHWNHTSTLMALIANCHRDPKKTRPAKPADFHPFAQRQSENRQPRKPIVGIEVLKQVFIDQHPS